MEKPLSLPEKIYLLGIHPLKGGIMGQVSSSMNYSIIGAILLELQKNGNIVIEEKRYVLKNHYSNESIQRFTLSKVKDGSKPQRIRYLISRLSFSARELKKRVRNSLVEKGFIKLTEKRFLYLIHWLSPVITDKKAVSQLIEDVEKQTFGKLNDQEVGLLLPLLIPANLLRRIFPEQHKRRLAKEKLKILTAADPIARTVQQAIWAAHAATAAAVS